MKKILVINGDAYSDAVTGDITFDKKILIHSPEEVGLLLFTGGADVSPELYHDTSPLGLCSTSPDRDREETKLFLVAQKYGIPCAGICRGLQFLNVMSGGTMMHHINGHAGSCHKIKTSLGQVIGVNSFHHQMVLPPEDSVVIAISTERLSGEYFGKNDEVVEYTGNEIEGAIFRHTKSFGVQWHPEWMAPRSEGHTFFKMMAYNALNMDWDKFIDYYSRKSIYADNFETDSGAVHSIPV